MTPRAPLALDRTPVPDAPAHAVPPVDPWPVLVRGTDVRRQDDYVIYGLVDPLEPQWVRYVGLTTNPRGRLEYHIANPGRASFGTSRDRWIAELESCRRCPDMVLLERCGSASDLPGRERYWIQYFDERGEADLNGEPFVRAARRRRKLEVTGA